MTLQEALDELYNNCKPNIENNSDACDLAYETLQKLIDDVTNLFSRHEV